MSQIIHGKITHFLLGKRMEVVLRHVYSDTKVRHVWINSLVARAFNFARMLRGCERRLAATSITVDSQGTRRWRTYLARSLAHRPVCVIYTLRQDRWLEYISPTAHSRNLLACCFLHFTNRANLVVLCIRQTALQGWKAPENRLLGRRGDMKGYERLRTAAIMSEVSRNTSPCQKYWIGRRCWLSPVYQPTPCYTTLNSPS